jgi:hypothetical protein
VARLKQMICTVKTANYRTRPVRRLGLDHLEEALDGDEMALGLTELVVGARARLGLTSEAFVQFVDELLA